MKGWSGNLEEMALANNYFRQVVYTAGHSQLVLMCLQRGEEIGMEVHPDRDQFFRFESGEGKVIIDGNEYQVTNGSGAILPAGAQHNIINTGEKELKLYTIYSPAEHRRDVVHKTKAEAVADHEEFDGKTTE